MPRRKIRLNYGNQKQFEVEIDSERLVAEPSAPQPNHRFKSELATALQRPIDFPSVEQAVIPGDRVTVALDRHTPGSATLVAGIWKALSPRGIDADHFTVIQPATRMASDLPDPRAELPEEIAGAGSLDPARPDSPGPLRLFGGHRHRRARLSGPGSCGRGFFDFGGADRLRSADGLSGHEQCVLSRSLVGRGHAADAGTRPSRAGTGRGPAAAGADRRNRLALGQPIHRPGDSGGGGGRFPSFGGGLRTGLYSGEKTADGAVAGRSRRAAGRRDCRHRPRSGPPRLGTPRGCG